MFDMTNWKKCKAHNKNYDSEKYPDGCFFCTHPEEYDPTKPATKKEAMNKTVAEIQTKIIPGEAIEGMKHFEISNQAMLMLVCNANNCAAEMVKGIHFLQLASGEQKETFIDLQAFILANSIAQAFKETV